jgi:uncharacterized protein (UPF0335 family)
MAPRRKKNAEPQIGDNSGEADFNTLQSFVDRIERLEDEIDGLRLDKSAVLKEAKFTGFDIKILRIVLRRRRRKAAELSEEEALIQTYEHALSN